MAFTHNWVLTYNSLAKVPLGLFAGLMFSLPFQGESKIDTGFRAGIYF